MKFSVLSAVALLAVLSAADAFAPSSAGLLRPGARAKATCRPALRVGRPLPLKVRTRSLDD